MSLELNQSPTTLNAMLNLFDEDHKIQFDKDKEAARQFFLQDINKNTVYFNSLEEKVEHLVENKYWEEDFIRKYSMHFIKDLFKELYGYKHRFKTYLGALKFYNQYALKTRDGSRYLERYEDRCAAVGLYLGQGDEKLARDIAVSILKGQFQPATPTFQNSGKYAGGGLTSCFLLDMQDSLESIGRTLDSAMVLSKNGGGIGVNFTNIREAGAPIKGIEGLSSGVIPILKVYEDAVTRFANQLGQRQGALVANLNIFHPDILQFLDTKKENADEGIRMRLLSIAVLIPDIFMEEAAKNHDIFLISPYEIEREYGITLSDFDITARYQELLDNPRISKKRKINARVLLSKIAEVAAESGYPYMIFIDTANKSMAVDGRIKMSNLCVTGDTMLLTSEGYRYMEELYNSQEEIKVLSDNRIVDDNVNSTGLCIFDSTPVFKTAENAPVFKVTVASGKSITATGYHKMFIYVDGEVVRRELLDLNKLDKLFIYNNGVQYTDQVVDIEYMGVQPVYDVTVADNSHSIITNDIVTGNCSEIFQPQTPSTFNEDFSYDTVGTDVACNLGSLIIDGVMDSGEPGRIIETAVRGLTNVANLLNEPGAPTVSRGNKEAHSIGISAMNLHGYLAREGIMYGDDDALEFVSSFFAMLRYHALRASNIIAQETGQTFVGFSKSKYASGEFFDKYMKNNYNPTREKVVALYEKAGITLPTHEDWLELKENVMLWGLYNRELMCVPPTGSISYIQSASPGLMPIPAPVEIRKEGMIGRVYYPAPYLTDDNLHLYKDAYELGYEAIINTFAKAQEHIDQGCSMNLYFEQQNTNTRQIVKAYIYAWKSGLKSTYYVRFQQEALQGTAIDCVSCSI